jgi:hypothetical protein
LFGKTEATNLFLGTGFSLMPFVGNPNPLHAVIQTNFASGVTYNNSYGVPILVNARVSLGAAAVAGQADIGLRCDASPANGGWTNDYAMSTLVTTIAMNYTNSLSITVPTNANWVFTNLSTGAGNTANVIGGQISY